jgi:hypothetical protein
VAGRDDVEMVEAFATTGQSPGRKLALKIKRSGILSPLYSGRLANRLQSIDTVIFDSL